MVKYRLQGLLPVIVDDVDQSLQMKSRRGETSSASLAATENFSCEQKLQSSLNDKCGLNGDSDMVTGLITC